MTEISGTGKGRQKLLSRFCLCALLLSCSGAPQAASRNEPPYKRVVAIGIGEIRDAGICLGYVGFVTSGDFFEGLKPQNTSEGRRFHKGPDEIKEFPGQLLLEVQGYFHSCNNPVLLSELDSVAQRDFLQTLTFKLEWKQDLEVRPVDNWSFELRPPAAAVWKEYDKPVWTFDFTLAPKGIALTNSLLLSIHGKSDKLLGRLSARL